jgi:hypothetical protein
MKAAAVVCTYGRVALCELLACVARQTLQLPTLVFFDGRLTYTDGSEVMRFDVPPLVEVVQAPRQLSLGLVRRAAVEAARECFELDAESVVLVLDDDDFYSSKHFELTLAALELARAAGWRGWTGALAMGLAIDGGAPELVHGDAGVGQHATWGFPLGAYDAAGGYLDVPRDEDVALGNALGWHHCRPHHHVTHVRRHHGANISALGFDRDVVRALDSLTTVVRPAPWSHELEQLELWCQLATPATH